jgi:hypothetical protein
MAGEMAFNVAPTNTTARLGATPTDVVASHADALIRYIRRWHWTALGWVSNYDRSNPAAAQGAARVQEAFGYRFVLGEVRYPAEVKDDRTLTVSFTVRNKGAAPFYFRWPVEVSLLDPATRRPVWKDCFADVDIRQWAPGDFSDKGKGRVLGDKNTTSFEWDTGIDYDIPAKPVTIQGAFTLPRTISRGTYILALAILDPAGDVPSVRFATTQYFDGGRHPVGLIGIDQTVAAPTLDATLFNAPNADRTLHYVLAASPK